MKTTLFLLFLTFSFLKADSYYDGKCVKEYSLGKSGLSYSLNIVYADNSSLITQGSLSTLEPILNTLTTNKDKFVSTSFKDGLSTVVSCGVVSSDNTFGLSSNEFNYLMAVYGIFLSSLIAFGLIKAF